MWVLYTPWSPEVEEALRRLATQGVVEEVTASAVRRRKAVGLQKKLCLLASELFCMTPCSTLGRTSNS
jgi:hypothetical protein